jgi:hypothetical protein
MKNIFKPEDFNMFELSKYSDKIPREACAAIANKKLNELIESWPRVYGYIGEYGSSWTDAPMGTFVQENYNSVASLAFIEPIKQECVKHEPILADWEMINDKWTGNCRECGVELVAEWKVRRGK